MGKIKSTKQKIFDSISIVLFVHDFQNAILKCNFFEINNLRNEVSAFVFYIVNICIYASYVIKYIN